MFSHFDSYLWSDRNTLHHHPSPPSEQLNILSVGQNYPSSPVFYTSGLRERESSLAGTTSTALDEKTSDSEGEQPKTPKGVPMLPPMERREFRKRIHQICLRDKLLVRGEEVSLHHFGAFEGQLTRCLGIDSFKRWLYCDMLLGRCCTEFVPLLAETLSHKRNTPTINNKIGAIQATTHTREMWLWEYLRTLGDLLEGRNVGLTSSADLASSGDKTVTAEGALKTAALPLTLLAPPEGVLGRKRSSSSPCAAATKQSAEETTAPPPANTEGSSSPPVAAVSSPSAVKKKKKEKVKGKKKEEVGSNNNKAEGGIEDAQNVKDSSKKKMKKKASNNNNNNSNNTEERLSKKKTLQALKKEIADLKEVLLEEERKSSFSETSQPSPPRVPSGWTDQRDNPITIKPKQQHQHPQTLHGAPQIEMLLEDFSNAFREFSPIDFSHLASELPANSFPSNTELFALVCTFTRTHIFFDTLALPNTCHSLYSGRKAACVCVCRV